MKLMLSDCKLYNESIVKKLYIVTNETPIKSRINLGK